MMLKIVVYGVAMASIWFWLYSLIRKEISMSMLKTWIKIIVPQGIVIALALILLGVI